MLIKKRTEANREKKKKKLLKRKIEKEKGKRT